MDVGKQAVKLPVYLDYMATTPVDARVVEAMQTCLALDGKFANPSSQHFYGWQASELVEAAAKQLADFIQCDSAEIIWTSGATEAINLALKGAACFYQRQGKHIVTLATEHQAVLDVCGALEREGFEVTYLKPEKNGLLDLTKLKAAIKKETILVSVLWVNNETGVIQGLSEIASLVKSQGKLLHVDAAQVLGKIPVDLAQLPIDLMSMSAHKVYGPKGIGALFVRQQPRVRLEPLIHGGGHQQNLRSGTLPVHQIVGFGLACEIAQQEMSAENARIKKLRDQLWQGIAQLEGVFINGDMTQRVAQNLNVCFESVDGEALEVGLKDLAVSRGSACTAATIEPSHVLTAMGLTRMQADQSIRFSLGRWTTAEDIELAIKQIQTVVNRLRALWH